MYLSDRFLRSLAPGGISAADQRAADEQLGRMFAAFWRARQRLARWGRALPVVLSVVVGTSAGFRNEPLQAPLPTEPELASSGLARAANGGGGPPR
jgi:hypothetical protein